MSDDPRVETVAAEIDPDAWRQDRPIPTRADMVSWFERRQRSCEKARAVLAAADKAAWRPISEAPGDQPVLVTDGIGNYVVAEWDSSAGGIWSRPESLYVGIHFTPTHFMPLPQPPPGG
jgi:hypothetical protein